MHWIGSKIILISLLLGMVGIPEAIRADDFRPRQLLVKPRAGLNPALRLRQLHAQNQHRVVRQFQRLGGWQLIELQEGESVAEKIRAYKASGLVEFAEPNYRLYAAALPDDPAVLNGSQWALTNIAAPAGWNLIHDASQVIVAVIDSGLRVTHLDLLTNLWTNPGEIAGDNLDNDGDNYIDDIHGFASYYNIAGDRVVGGDVTDTYGHGTHIAGIIGGVGNNGFGGTGVAWRVKLMALKFLNEVGDGSVEDAIACIDYAIAHGAKIINASWNGASYSRSLEDAFLAARNAGVLVVTAAGNENRDNDVIPMYPGQFGFDNILVVTANARNESIWKSSSTYGANTGKNSIDLAAPGEDIYSTGIFSDYSFARKNGTSFSTAFVTGAAALLSARFPHLTAAELRQRITESVDVLPAFVGKTRTGGRLNLAKALQTNPAFDLRLAFERSATSSEIIYQRYPLFSPLILESSTNLTTWSALRTNTINIPPPWTQPIPTSNHSALFYRLRSP